MKQVVQGLSSPTCVRRRYALFRELRLRYGAITPNTQVTDKTEQKCLFFYACIKRRSERVLYIGGALLSCQCCGKENGRLFGGCYYIGPEDNVVYCTECWQAIGYPKHYLKEESL